MAKRTVRTAKTIREVIAATQGDLSRLTVRELQSAKRYQDLQQKMKAAITAGLGDKYSYRRAELAEIMGVNERSISRYSKQGKLPQSKGGFWDIRQVVKSLHIQLADTNQEGTPDDRLKTVKALREELRLSHESDQVIDRDTFLREASVRLTAARDRAASWMEQFVRNFPGDQRVEMMERLRKEVEAFLRMEAAAIRDPWSMQKGAKE